jgi:hypothetical protein
MIQPMKSPRKTVALTDPRWSGHHPTYFKEFFASMVRLGVRVIALCPDPDGFRKSAASICEDLGLEVDEWIVTGDLPVTECGFFTRRFDHDPPMVGLAAGPAARGGEIGVESGICVHGLAGFVFAFSSLVRPCGPDTGSSLGGGSIFGITISPGGRTASREE